jgi:hypothetical protein
MLIVCIVQLNGNNAYDNKTLSTIYCPVFFVRKQCVYFLLFHMSLSSKK